MSADGQLTVVCKGKGVQCLTEFITLVHPFVDHYFLENLIDKNTLQEVLDAINRNPKHFVHSQDAMSSERRFIFLCFKNGDRVVDLYAQENPSLPGRVNLVLGFPEFKVDMNNSFVRILLQITPAIMRKMHPESISGYGGYVLSAYDSFFQYHLDPLMFAFYDDGESFSYQQLASVLSPTEMKTLIRRNRGSFTLFEEKNIPGIGVIKSYRIHTTTDEEKLFAVYPHYFIRKELKKRGLKIADGLPEEYAKKLGIT